MLAEVDSPNVVVLLGKVWVLGKFCGDDCPVAVEPRADDNFVSIVSPGFMKIGFGLVKGVTGVL